MEHVLTNVLGLIIESLIRNTLTHNGYEYIEEFVNITDTDNQKLHYETFIKELKYLSLGHQNLIWSFIEYSEYRTYDNQPIGYEWTKITNETFNDLHMKDFIILEGCVRLEL